MTTIRGDNLSPSGLPDLNIAPSTVKYRPGERGFTMVELLVVSAILAVLVTLTIPSYNQFIDRTKNTSSIQDVRSLQMDITAYLNDHGDFPASLANIGRGNTRDPWGNLYQYRYPAVRTAITPLNPMSYDLFSFGKDGQSDDDLLEDVSKDDIVRASDGGFIGLGYEF